MSHPEFHLDVGILGEHARMVDGVAEMLDAVTAAVGHLRLDSGVYGEWPGPSSPDFSASRKIRRYRTRAVPRTRPRTWLTCCGRSA